MMKENKKCVFSGTFDPPTTGHKNVILTCLKIFDEVVVAVMVNPEKTPYLKTEDRVALLKKLFKDEPRVRVTTFTGAAVDILEKENTPFYVRGIRNGVDLDFENANRFASERLKKDIVTVYLPAGREDIETSSTLVKTCVKFNKDVTPYVPEEILQDFINLTEKKDV